MKVFQKVNFDLNSAAVFHTDRGKEFDNILIDDLLSNYKIKRSLSKKGCPYDNAVAETTFKIVKTEFVQERTFCSLDQLRLEYSDYVHWFNCCRIHSSLNYMTPVEFKSNSLKNLSN